METTESIRLSPITLQAKLFLMVLACKDIEVSIFDSMSELYFSKGFRWVRETDSTGYYEELLSEIKPGSKIALVRKDLIRDLDMKLDAEQIREIKQSMIETCPGCGSDNIANEDETEAVTCHDCSHQWDEAV